MSELRMILLLIGVGVIVAVYAWTRYQQASRRSAVKTTTTSKLVRDEPDAADIQEQLARMERLVIDRDDDDDDASAAVAPHIEEQPGKERLLVISIVAPDGEVFGGAALARAFEHNDLRMSDQGIFQRVFFHAGRELQVFGVANLVKPGTFEPENMDEFSSPGVTLFLQLPCALSGVEAFDDFVNTAERLAVELGGELRDERHAVLTHQVLMQTRESILAARFHPRVAS